MSKTTDKMNKLAIQHKAIGVKIDCKYFSNIGNLCSRVENGMMRCDEYLECEFKYIDALKQEKENLKQQLEIDKNQINYFIEENEKLKTQYNCYACGNCKGKEDYINLEKHHKGLRKQFDKQNKKLRDIQEIVQGFCNACKEFEPEKSENKKTCLYCNYEKILDIINDQKGSEVME